MLLESALLAEPIPVKLDPEHGLQRNGVAYFIKGAGGETRLDELKRRGGNSLRTWSQDQLDQNLAEAAKHGLTVCAGIWLEPECNWFSYANPEHCARQTERVKKTILQFRDHPALLLWGLGNEMEGDGKNIAYWQQLDRLAQMVKQEDPSHPTLTALAGMTADKAKGLNEHAPHLDMVGINTYGGLFNLRQHLQNVGWQRPWIVTEFGPQGFWESGRSAWGAPLEQTSTQKADMLRKVYPAVIAPGGACLGSYVFLWGQKQEATATWFSLFTPQAESTESVDVLEEMWSGRKPANQAPVLKELKGAAAKSTLSSAQSFEVQVEASDADQDVLTCRWEIVPEKGGREKEGRELAIPVISTVSTTDLQIALEAPGKAGEYRLFVYVSDGKGHAATANFPFLVK
ncbi:glycoside hydrolase family 2 TIM barrel-domain containing protein [soil metagenome]